MKVNLSNLNRSTVLRTCKPYIPETYNGILIVGDHTYGEGDTEPFARSHGSELARWLGGVGENFRSCAHACVLDFIPSKKHFTVVRKKALLNFSDLEVVSAVGALEEVIKAVKPRLILALGDIPLQYFKPDGSNLDDERGAPFLFRNIPVLCTYHPRQIFQRYKVLPIMEHDLKKAVRLARSGWKPPTYEINFLPTFEETIRLLDQFIEYKPFLSVDFECLSDFTLTCVGIAYSTHQALVIPFFKEKQKPYFSMQEEVEVWKRLRIVLSECRLVGHNAVHFDHYLAMRKYSLLTNFIADTMFAQWECYAEMPKSLAFISSLYTDNPYWKGVLREARSGRVAYWKEYEYCGKDVIVCYQCAKALGKELKELPAPVLQHYQFNIATSRPFQYMAMRGARIDQELYGKRVVEVEAEVRELTRQFEIESGRAHQDLIEEKLTASEKRKFSVRSPIKMKNWLYKDLGLPVQTKLAKNEFGDMESRETADYLSLLYLGYMYPEHPAVLTAGKLRKTLKRLSTLQSFRWDKNGYVHWTFNLVGTETGRASGYKPLDGVGIQPQNVDRRERDLFLPPEGKHWLKADLEGADSWTVAAMLNALGHSQMLEDLLAGIKPAQRLAIAELVGWHLMSAPPSELLQYKKLLKSENGQLVYRISKAVGHGSAYMMKPPTMHKNIFKQSDGDLFVEPRECQVRQKQLNDYYHLPVLHNFMEGKLVSEGSLLSAAGTNRIFFGRRDAATLRTMLSHLPQAHTGYSTNVVINRLFYSAKNRRGSSFILEPINQVHDETNQAFRHEDVELAAQLFWDNCSVPLSVWGTDITIPFEAAYGDNWGNAKTELINPYAS